MKINRKDFLNIKTLLEDETITEGKFSNKDIVARLKQNGSVVDGKKTPKVRYINLSKKENIFLFLHNYGYNISSIYDIDRYIEEIFDAKTSRATSQKWHDDTKAVNSPSQKGLYISSLKEIDIKLDGKTITILPNDGLGYFLFHTKKVEVFKETIIVGVENYQVIWFNQKFQKFFENKKMLFVVINPFMLEWIESLENEYVHFGDYDLAGINIYLSKIILRLKKSKK